MSANTSPVGNDGLPLTGFLRLSQIVGSPGDPTASPPVPPTPGLIPISKASWWMGVRAGHYPKPVKISANTTAWRVSDIRALIERLNGDNDEEQAA